MDVREYNKTAWNRHVDRGNPWTLPVDSQRVAAAREGRWEVLLTPSKPVPRSWFPELKGADVLCLACGGGQQGPLFAAAGANVVVLDNSPRQLQQDMLVAQREGLPLRTVEGDMCNLGMFGNASFDLVFHPVSTVFVPDVQPVWREAFRVLRPGGVLLCGHTNPFMYIFDPIKAERDGVLEAKYALPYADADHPEIRQWAMDAGQPLEHSHTLQSLIGGQLEAGLVMTGFYEDTDPEKPDPLASLVPLYMATRAVKR